MNKAYLNRFLKEYGYEGFDPAIIDGLLEFFNERNISTSEAKDIISGVKKKEILLGEPTKLVSLSTEELLKKLQGAKDLEQFKEIDRVVGEFRKYYRSKGLKTPGMEKFIKEIYEIIKQKSTELNQDVNEITKGQIEKLFQASAIFNSINNHTQPTSGEDRKTDKIVKKIVESTVANQERELNHKLVENVEAVLRELATKREGISDEEVYSGAELARLLEHTTSIVYDGSVAKIQSAREVFGVYLENLRESVENTDETREVLSKITVKGLTLKAGSILQRPTEYLNQAIGFMNGARVSDLVSEKKGANTNKDKLLKYFPNLKIEGFDLRKKVVLLQRYPGMLSSLTTNTIFDANERLINGIYSIYDNNEATIENKIEILKQKGFDLDDLIHADNLNELINSKALESAEQQKHFTTNSLIMLQIIKPADLQKIIQHNIGFLTQDSKVLISQLKEIDEKYKTNPTKYKQELEGFVNSLQTIKKSTKGKLGGLAGTKEPVLVSFGKTLDDQKEYIELDLNLGEPIKVVEPIKKRVEPTPEEALNQIYLELAELKAYLNAVIKGEEVNVTSSKTVANHLADIRKRKRVENAMGTTKNRVINLQRMFTIVENSGIETPGLVREIDEIRTLLELASAEVEIEGMNHQHNGDLFVLEEQNRDKSAGKAIVKIKKNIEHYEDMEIEDPEIQAIFDDRLAESELFKEKYEENFKAIHQKRRKIAVAYAYSTACEEQSHGINALKILLGEESGIIKQKSASQAQEVEEKPSNEELIAHLKHSYNKKLRRFNEVFPTDKAKNHSYARKWREKISKLRAQIDALIAESESQPSEK